MNQPATPPDLIPFLIPPHPGPISLAQARVDLPPEEFRRRLRAHLEAHPGLTLAQVGRELHVTRQCVSHIVGRLNRPNCTALPGRRPAPKREAAKQRMAELKQRVAQGETAESAAFALQISLNQARVLGFKVYGVRSAHGTAARVQAGCDCWRCRKASGAALPRGPRSGAIRRAQVEDWLAYRDPDTNEALTQARIGKLVGVAQPRVSRIARAVENS